MLVMIVTEELSDKVEENKEVDNKPTITDNKYELDVKIHLNNVGKHIGTANVWNHSYNKMPFRRKYKN